VAGAVWMAGCAVSSAPPPTQIRTMNGTVLILNDILSATVHVVEVAESHDPSGRLIAHAKFQNTTSSALQIQAMTLFKDKAGATLESSPWADLSLLPQERIRYSAAATNPACNRFVVTVRYRSAIRKGEKN
jgi:hypothetical protein